MDDIHGVHGSFLQGHGCKRSRACRAATEKHFVPRSPQWCWSICQSRVRFSVPSNPTDSGSLPGNLHLSSNQNKLQSPWLWPSFLSSSLDSWEHHLNSFSTMMFSFDLPYPQCSFPFSSVWYGDHSPIICFHFPWLWSHEDAYFLHDVYAGHPPWCAEETSGWDWQSSAQ